MVVADLTMPDAFSTGLTAVPPYKPNIHAPPIPLYGNILVLSALLYISVTHTHNVHSSLPWNTPALVHRGTHADAFRA